MSTNLSKLRSLLSIHEGRIRSAYQDKLGYWTIGVGHLVDSRRGAGLPEHIVDALLDSDIATTQKQLREALPWTDDLDEVRLAVLLDMGFNLGVQGLLKFVNTLRYIHDGDYQQAAEEMLKSKWATQVGPGRAGRLAKMMATGEWPKELTDG